MIYAAYSDITTMTIPNKLSLVLIGGFLFVALVAGMSIGQIAVHIAVAFGVLLVGMGLFAMNLIGGGDAKFVAATSLWMGTGGVFSYVILFSIIGGVFALAMLSFRKMPLPEILCKQPWIARLHDAAVGIPYGVALSIGGLIIFPSTAIFALAGA
jgi:prepilin peptidase CpaA